MTITSTAQELKRLSTTVLDEAYFRLAKKEALTGDEDAALAIANPSQRELENQICRCGSILDHQKKAGSATEREDAARRLDDARVTSSSMRDRLTDEIAKLQTELEAVDPQTLEPIAELVRLQTDSVEILRSLAPDYLKHAVRRDFVTKKLPLQNEQDELESQIEFFDRLATLEAGPNDVNPSSINLPAREFLGLDRDVVSSKHTPQVVPTFAGKDKHVPGKIEITVEPFPLSAAQKMAKQKRPSVEKRLAEVTGELLAMDQAEVDWKNFYVPS